MFNMNVIYLIILSPIHILFETNRCLDDYLTKKKIIIIHVYNMCTYLTNNEYVIIFL